MSEDLQAQREALVGLPETIATSFTDVESVVVLRGGHVVFEYYQPGSNQDTLRDTQSVTKSVLSMLVGIAADEGAIASLDQPIAALLPAGTTVTADADRAPVTVRHLLTMRAGFAPSGRVSRAESDHPQYLANRPVKAPPGAEFLYDDLAANLLAIALENATRQGVSELAQKKLFGPLGIDLFDWKKGPNGHHYGSSGLRLRTRDMAKLGQLMLQQGVWNEQQLISKSYAGEAVQRQTSADQPAYGYMWWLPPSGTASQTFFASGFGGQLIWVHKPLDLVVATTAAATASSQARGHAMKLVREDIFRLITRPAPAR
ncbi:beta-lactamase family protein [Schlegelella sp. S2-27]|uniref:Beta-lactamase family protein n=1 Tax=Caldimonas mangrovi TaxID=2944811 RepID=A0ABT0YXV4_9BURK|nr:serine hydrolase [Caldimonas mangrovi]MCM5682668.1 beta-lactamase family protein [Caldimonas mangrovi]